MIFVQNRLENEVFWHHAVSEPVDARYNPFGKHKDASVVFYTHTWMTLPTCE